MNKEIIIQVAFKGAVECAVNGKAEVNEIKNRMESRPLAYLWHRYRIVWKSHGKSYRVIDTLIRVT